MNKIKIIIGLFSFILLLAGCSGNDDSTAGESDDDGQVTITFHHWFDEESNNWPEVWEAFEEEYPHINLEPVSMGANADEFLETLDINAAGGGDFDVVAIPSESALNQRAINGMFEPLNEYMEEAGINMEEDFVVDLVAEDGMYYGFPLKNIHEFVMLNKEALDEADLDVPTEWTWDEYMDYAAALTEGEGSNKRYGTYFVEWPQYRMAALVSEEYQMIKEDGETSNFDDPLFRKSLEIRQQGEEEGSATPHADIIGAGLDYRSEYFAGRVAMLPIKSYMIPEAGGFAGYEPDFTTAFAPYPTVEEGDSITAMGGTETIAISSGSENKEEAFEFIHWYVTEGVIQQEVYIPPTTDVNYEEVVDRVLEGAPASDKVDQESLAHVLEVTETVLLDTHPATTELSDMLAHSTDEFLLGNEDIDTTIENVHENAQQIIDQYN